ncbi:SDR family NAD(P)-dependent oxidoreductase [Nocardioides pyridinolyticus]
MPEGAGRGTAVVTGGGSGIGQAVARRLVSRGHTVVAFDRSFADDGPPGPGLRQMVADISDPGTWGAALATIEEPVDVVVNAAAVRPTGPVDEVTEQEWRQCLDVNIVGASLLIADAVPRMVNGGHIINIASGAAFGKRSLGVYGASKAALVSLTRTAALELAPRGIRVNVVVPGTTDTRMLHEARGSGTATTDSSSPRNLGGHTLSPDDVARDVVACLDLALVTGALLPVGLLPWEW